MPTIDIDSDAAHEAAQHELAKPIYPKGSLIERVIDWAEDLLYRLSVQGASVPGGWLTVTVLAILLAVAVVVAVRVARRTMRTGRGRSVGLFGDQMLTAAQHRGLAERAAAAGDWAAAIRHRLRAVARHLEELGVLDPVPGRTATELARDAGSRIPALSDELSCAATAFNDVSYGQRPGTEGAYRIIAGVDDRIGSHAPVVASAVAGPPTPDGWAEIR
ncbi:DUF4129 domain-containing protein [Mycobacterium sp. E740]|uniref:DUF4129 domain-containing protein n=1 Tax=Mycobacterium sp. E740 TaxID=1834149 RepID=UPI0007FFE758|nr:DUF4129 domain-containing protein [Mycobacterium sp. E740]OBI75097.1 hypothetical protein A5663_04445 [Mycobacterium sp. E740]